MERIEIFFRNSSEIVDMKKRVRVEIQSRNVTSKIMAVPKINLECLVALLGTGEVSNLALLVLEAGDLFDIRQSSGDRCLHLLLFRLAGTVRCGE